MPIFVVVSGLPASGKSTWARRLGAALGLPVLDKDTILESLFDRAPVVDVAQRQALSREADRVLQAQAEALDRAVLVSWWRHPASPEPTGTDVAWLSAPGVRGIEVHVACPPALAARRFLSRERHPGHHDDRWDEGELRAWMERHSRSGALGFEPCIECGPDVEEGFADTRAALERALAAASEPPVTLRAMTERDLPMLHAWLNRPHLVEWWGGEEARPTLAEVMEDYAPAAMAREGVTPYIAMLGDEPIGYAQSYVALGSGGGWWEGETDPGVRGIDQSLADPARLGRGLGTRLVRALVERLFADPAVTKIQTDPAPHNARAIRCYEKAGFVRRGIIDTPDGPALYMVREREALESGVSPPRSGKQR